MGRGWRPTLGAASLERHNTIWEKQRAKRPQQELGWLPQESASLLDKHTFSLLNSNGDNGKVLFATILSPAGGQGQRVIADWAAAEEIRSGQGEQREECQGMLFREPRSSD